MGGRPTRGLPAPLCHPRGLRRQDRPCSQTLGSPALCTRLVSGRGRGHRSGLSPRAVHRVRGSERRLGGVDPEAGACAQTCTPRPANGSCCITQRLPRGLPVISLVAGAAQGMFSETFADRAMGRGQGSAGLRAPEFAASVRGQQLRSEQKCGLRPQASRTGLPLCDGLNSFLANGRVSLKLVGVLTTVGRLKHWETHLSQGGGTQDSPSGLSPWEPPPRPPKPLVLHWRGCMPSAGP